MTDPQEALAACLELNEREAWSGLTGLAALDTHRETVVKQVLSIQDEEIRPLAMKLLFETWARSDPRGAAAWLDEQGLSDRELEKVIAGRFARLDPEANADWLLNRAEPGEARDAAAQLALSSWARNDPEAAGAWLESRGITGEQAIRSMISGYAARDIDRAIEWAQRADASKRDDFIAQAIAAAVSHTTIKSTEIGNYTGSGSLSKEEMAQESGTRLELVIGRFRILNESGWNDPISP